MNRIVLPIVAGALFLCGLVPSHAADHRRPFTIADFYHLKSIEDPQYSPDGSMIAFTVRTDNLAKGRTNTDVYVIRKDGTGLRQMTQGPAGDDSPRWSPDGSSLLFLSSRADGSQAWALPLAGGEPRQITTFSMGVGGPVWLPSGKGFLFATDVFPECGADPECNARNDESLSSGPLQAHMADHLLYRHWTEWKDGKRTHTFLHDLGTGTITDLTPGDFDAPAFSLGGTGYAVSPDGKELCVVSNHDSVEATSTNSDLWIIPTAGGPAVNITAANRAFDGDPAYSPDGRYLAYRLQTIPGYESDCFRLALYDRATGARRILTEGIDNWVTDFRWAPDSRSIYFLVEEKAATPLYNVSLQGKITPILRDKTIDAFAVSPTGSSIAYVRRGIAEPRELWQVNADGSRPTQLTFFNKPVVDSVDIRPAEELWITSPTGARVHTFLVKPHGFDPKKKYPIILNVHGGPQSQWADAFRGDWQVYPGAGYIVAFPNPAGSTGFGQAYTAAISKDWNGRVYQDIMAVADSLAHLPYVDAERMGAMGWSYGGYMMMWLEGHTTRFKAIACMMGVYDLTAMHGATEELWFPRWEFNGKPWDSPLYTSLSPNQAVKNFKTPCLVITGERDYRVPYTQSLEFFTDLQSMNVPSRLIVFKNDGHWPSGVKSMPFYYNAHLDWFHTYLGGDPAPYDMTKMLRNQAFEK